MKKNTTNSNVPLTNRLNIKNILFIVFSSITLAIVFVMCYESIKDASGHEPSTSASSAESLVQSNFDHPLISPNIKCSGLGQEIKNFKPSIQAYVDKVVAGGQVKRVTVRFRSYDD